MDKIIKINDLQELSTSLDSLFNQISNYKELLEITVEDITSIRFLSASEFAEIYGCGVKQAQRIFALPDFPSSDFGKEKKAELTAVKKYFQRHIEKAHLKYWDAA